MRFRFRAHQIARLFKLPSTIIVSVAAAGNVSLKHQPVKTRETLKFEYVISHCIERHWLQPTGCSRPDCILCLMDNALLDGEQITVAA